MQLRLRKPSQIKMSSLVVLVLLSRKPSRVNNVLVATEMEVVSVELKPSQCSVVVPQDELVTQSDITTSDAPNDKNNELTANDNNIRGFDFINYFDITN